MEILRHPGAGGPGGPTVVTVGTFDAVHRGHEALLARVQEEARTRSARSAVVTFDPHPLEVVRPEAAPCRLQTLDQRLQRFELVGIDVTLVLEFDDGLSRLTPETFVADVLVGTMEVGGVVVGSDFRFGHRRRGDIALLAKLGEQHGFVVEAFDLVASEGDVISSTDIRALVGEGDVARAAELLGRPFRLAGEVVHGDGRGRAIGFPTANLRTQERACLPGLGVYAGAWRWKDVWHPGVINVGVRPTFERSDATTVEVHVFDLDADLYGERGEVEFTARLRDEVRFPSVDLLVEQMHRDAEEARRILAAVRGLGETPRS